MAGVGSDTELLTEHLGYPPVSLLDDIINSVNVLVDKGITGVENGLLNMDPSSLGFHPSKPSKTPSSSSEPPADPKDALRFEVENGTHKLETLLFQAVDVNFDKFELYVMRNILAVAPDDRAFVRLAHYEGLDFSGVQTEGEEEGRGVGDVPGVESINALRRRLQASQRLNVMLEAEKAKNEALLGTLRGLVGRGAPGVKAEEGGMKEGAPLAFLLEKGELRDADAERPLTATTAFTLSQMEALRKLSGDLRKLAPGLAKAGKDADDDGVKGWRRDRVEYIESATRRHLEHTRGLELGKDGDVRDGEWQGEGRRLASGEVEGLEQVVAVLGGAAGGTTSAARNDEMDTS